MTLNEKKYLEYKLLYIFIHIVGRYTVDHIYMHMNNIYGVQCTSIIFIFDIFDWILIVFKV